MQHLVLFIQHHDGAGSQTYQRAGGEGYAVILQEGGTTQGGEGYHLVQPFGAAEAGLGERQVGGDAEHDGVVQSAGLLVELAHRGSAGRGIDAREDVQDLALTGEARQGQVGEILGDQSEGLGLLTGKREVASDGNRVALQSD